MLRTNLQRDQMESASRWSTAMREAGVPDETIDVVLDTALADRDAKQADSLDQIEETMYVGEVPEGFTTIDDAAARHHLNRDTLYGWCRLGYLRVRGRLRHPGRGGGKVVISEADLTELLVSPPKRGRPKNPRLS